MTDYVIDTYAWIEYLIGSHKGEKVKGILENRTNNIFTSIVSLSELVSIIKREGGDYNAVYYKVISLSKLAGVSPEFCKQVGVEHANMRTKVKDFGLADAFVLTVAKKLDAKIVTGDPHFKSIKGAIIL